MAKTKETGVVISTKIGLEDLAPESFNLEHINKYLALKCDGIEDKEGYKAVEKAHKEAKKILAEIEKRRKALKAPALEYNKKVEKLATELKEKLQPAIDHLAEHRKEYEEEKERIKREAEEARQKLIAERTAKLFELGFMFNGEEYVLEDPVHKDNPMIMKPISIEEIEDGLFEEFCRKADRIAKIKAAEEAEVQAKLKRLEEIEAKEKEEKERIESAKRPATPEESFNSDSSDPDPAEEDETNLYTEADLVSFGNYLLSEERKNRVDDLLQRSVTDADLANWSEIENSK